MTRSRFSPLALTLCLRVATQYGLAKAVVDGYKLAKKIGERFLVHKIPMVRIEKLHRLPIYIAYRRLLTQDIQQYICRNFQNCVLGNF